MTDKPELRRERDDGGELVLSKTGGAYSISVTEGPQLSEGELKIIGRYVSDDTDGQDLLRALKIIE